MTLMRQDSRNKSARLFLALSVMICTSAYAETKWQWGYGVQSQYANFSEDKRKAEVLATKVRGTLDIEVNHSLTLSFALDHVVTHFNDSYFDGVTDNGELQITAPESTRINHATVLWENEAWLSRFGRMSFSLTDEALVSDFDDWPVEQVFDGGQFEKSFGSQSRLRYSYFNQVHRVYGSHADESLSEADIRFAALNGRRPVNQLGTHDIDFHLLELIQEDWQYLKLTSFIWHLEHQDIPQQSSQTLGFNLVYQQKPDQINYQLLMQAAYQKPINNALESNVLFYSLEAGIGLGASEFFMKQQESESRGDNWFRVPFSYTQDYYGHYWQYNAGSGGLINQAAGMRWRKRSIKLAASFHQFEQSKDHDALGNQWLLSATYRFARQHNLTLRLSLFDDKTKSPYLARDLNKLWLIYRYQI